MDMCPFCKAEDRGDERYLCGVEHKRGLPTRNCYERQIAAIQNELNALRKLKWLPQDIGRGADGTKINFKIGELFWYYNYRDPEGKIWA